jgi:hypothetical protein
MTSGVTMQERRPLKHNRSFITLMAAQAISNLGDWLHLLAILTLVGNASESRGVLDLGLNVNVDAESKNSTVVESNR